MMYRQKRRTHSNSRSSRAQQTVTEGQNSYLDHHPKRGDSSAAEQADGNTGVLIDNYRPDVMTLHSLGVAAVGSSEQPSWLRFNHQKSSNHYSSRSIHHNTNAHPGKNTHLSHLSLTTQTKLASGVVRSDRSFMRANNNPNGRSHHQGTADHSSVGLFNGPQRLHKILAHVGIGSRRDMEQLILEGRVSVNGRPAEIGQKITATDAVRVNGKLMKFTIRDSAPKLLMYHKSEGEIVSRDDPEKRATVFDRLPRISGSRWIPIGRLDFNTAGLLLFTTSGDFANYMMHPRYEVEREYSVRVPGALTEAEENLLTTGVVLEDGIASFKRLGRVHHVDSYDVVLPAEDDPSAVSHSWYRAVIAEGRTREVRRMFAAVGKTVSRLVRVRYGSFKLPSNLKRGQWREVDSRQVAQLMEEASKALASTAASGDAGGSSPHAVSSHYARKVRVGRAPVQRRRWLNARRKMSLPTS